MRNDPDKAHILLVDDDLDMCASLADVIELESAYSAEFTTSPLKAIELVKDNPFDIAILDYKMPEMNGIELLREIKKIKPRLTVFLLTAFLSDELVKKAKQSGAREVFSKFIWPDKILEVLKKSLS